MVSIIYAVLYQFQIISLTWWIVIGITSIILFALRHKRDQLIGNCLIIYVILTYIITFLGRKQISGLSYSDLYNIDLIGTWIKRITGSSIDKHELLLNVFMLMPIGFLYPLATRKSIIPTTLVCFLLTTTIEIAQFLSRRGWLELADIVDNTMGAVIGYGIYRLVSLLRENNKC